VSRRLVGVRPLLPVALHQDARNIAPWIVLISALSASSVLAYDWVFPEQAERTELSLTVSANPALSLVFGPARDLMTADGFNAWRAGMLGAFFAGLMAIFIVTRNTRAQEDSGQAELLASGVMSRPARLATALIMAVAASVALGVLASALTLLFGGGLVETLLLAATFTASGLIWAGLAAVAAQVGSDARSANTIAIAIVGGLFVARGYIDASQAPDWMVWLTPFGWLEQVRPAGDHNLWPLLLALALAVVLAGIAFLLQARRDFGMGLLPPRPGPARGGWVAHPWGLTLRLNLGAIVSWTVAFVALGFVFGVLATSVGEVLTANPAIAQALAAGAVSQGGLAFAFLVTILSLVGIIAGVYGVQIVMRVYAEENADRVDPLLAGSLSRPRYLAATVLIAFVGPAIAMVVGGVIIGTVAAASEPNIVASDVIRQSIATVPAVWTLTALSIAVVGAEPRVRLIGWLGLVASFALTILGPLFKLWDWILGISPFWHVPNVTLPEPDWSGLLWLGLVTVVLTAVGFAGFRRRDII
jgi:ABC-2 type transport system permease protein